MLSSGKNQSGHNESARDSFEKDAHHGQNEEYTDCLAEINELFFFGIEAALSPLST